VTFRGCMVYGVSHVQANFDCIVNFPVTAADSFSCDMYQEDNQLALQGIVDYGSNVEQIIDRETDQRQNNQAIT